MSHESVYPVHDFHHLDSVNFGYGNENYFADFTALVFHPVKTGLLRGNLKKEKSMD